MKHALSVIVEDRPGALTRITTMFARRGFNIESLAVGPTERAGVSCITLRVDCTQHSLEQIEKQIHKLVNVLRVTELVAGEAVERELLVIRVSAAPEKRAELVTTAEALGGSDPVQRAFATAQAFQCGWCTPGFVLAARALLEENPDPSDEEIRVALGGNLCRCTGYANILRAVRRAASGA